METLITILAIAILIEWRLKPRFDYVIDTNNNEGWIILWYGKHTRDYVKIFKYYKHN